jgi:hypothetical protein
LLRSILSDDPQEPISQAKLAKYIATPVTTIKAIEAGIAPMGKIVATRIKKGVGAKWVEWRRRWEFDFDPAGYLDNRREPEERIVYTHEVWVMYRNFLQQPPVNRKEVIKKLSNKVRFLMEKVSEDHFNALRLSLERAIAEWQVEFEVSGKVSIGKGREIEVGELFQLLRPIFLLGFDRETGNLQSLMQGEWPDPDKAGFPGSRTELCEALAEAIERELGEESAVPGKTAA